MNFKKYSAAFILLLCLLGISSQQKMVVANQEVVLQFSDDAMRSANAENVINVVKNLLLTVGVQDIEIEKLANGVLKIKYYSEAEVVDVKRLFSEDRVLDLELSKRRFGACEIPCDKQVDLCNVKVFVIQKQKDQSIGLSKKGISVQKNDVERFINPSDFSSNNHKIAGASIPVEQIKIEFLDVSKFISFYHTYKIPEVRAGPRA